MNSLFLLIPLSILLVGAAVAFLLWAIRGGQFEDLDRYEKHLPDDDD